MAKPSQEALRTPSLAAKAIMPRWEYLTVQAPEASDLSEHGRSGWELVSVVRASRPDWVIAYFKRRLPE